MSPTENKELHRASAIMDGAIELSVVGPTADGSGPEVDPPATSDTVAVAKNAALPAQKGKKLLPTTTRVPVTVNLYQTKAARGGK